MSEVNNLKVLVTGGAGFIGSNFIIRLLGLLRDVQIVNFDKLTYAGNLENLRNAENDPRYGFVQGDITDRAALTGLLAQGFDVLVHFAAETHVDRSIEHAGPFLSTNILGTVNLLEAARRHANLLFLHISTDEVFGSATPGLSFSEDSAFDPRSPYAASKASAEHFVRAYSTTYGLRTVILRCTNNFGPYQFPEKLIPLIIANALENSSVPVYGDGVQERDWIFVEDFCDAIALAMERAKPGSAYNISSGISRPNLQVVRAILESLGKPESLIKHVEDRPGHDRRYALDSTKFRKEFNWLPKVSFEEGIRRTIEWYQSNSPWLDHARSGEYQGYYARHYTKRSQMFQG
jgi:dTDP-glucose 4,6-dehydratase